MLTVKVEGYAAAVDIIGQLPKQLQKRILKTVLRKSTKPMLDAAKRNVPVKSGELRSKLKTVAFKRVDSPTEVAVAVKHHFAKNKIKGTINEFYGKFVHEGTADVRTPRKKGRVMAFKGKDGKMIFVKSVKGIKGTPYLEKAYDEQSAMVEQKFGDNLADAVEKFAAKNLKKLMP